MSQGTDHESKWGALSLEAATEIAAQLQRRISAAIFGQEDLVTEALICLIGGGHLLMTGAPGLAKTTLVRVFAQNLSLQFGRVQFTPDLLPSDITGSEILNIDPETSRRSFEFAKGPIFANLLLADEINRASPRTQSALLEAMQERTVTVNGKRHILPQPFWVFATQNPFESEGTFPLPEAQLDRFFMHALVGYPGLEAEKNMLSVHASGQLAGEMVHLEQGQPPLAPGAIEALMKVARSIPFDDTLIRAVTEFVRSSRPQDELCPRTIRDALWYGAGPRAGIAMIGACRALALITKSESVRWQHVVRVAKPVMRHRLRLTPHAARDGITEDMIIDQLLERIQSDRSNQALGIN